jgi:hypothetical protein
MAFSQRENVRRMREQSLQVLKAFAAELGKQQSALKVAQAKNEACFESCLNLATELRLFRDRGFLGRLKWVLLGR